RGESASIYFELLPENVTDKTVSFSSDNVNIAEVSEYGVVSGIEPGTAVISVFAGEIERRAAVTVIENVTAIEVSTDRRSYLAGDEGQLLISITPQGATRADLTVAVSGTEITLGGDDTFKAVSHGEVTVTVTAANGVEGVHTFFVVDLEILAEEVFQLTNLEREAGGLHPFEASEPLSITALVRAGEIIEEFSHSRPGGRDFFTAFTENDVEFTVAGENLAAGHRTPEEVLRGWMDSPGHRANIVNPSFYYLGVGVAIDEDGRLYWTQAFTG
ncbi:MAG: CAP domain-containing protein, partial [Oscillospiraceae bacterium]|nr:CAP domain-containing protein [Oscillospiraceae bacterium]